MASEFLLSIYTPNRLFFEHKVDGVVFNTSEGKFGVLAGHAPTIASLSPGVASISVKGKWMDAALTEGFAQVRGDEVRVFVDSAEWPEEVDLKRAEAAYDRAKERLKTKQDYVEHTRSLAAMHRAVARMSLKGAGKG